MKHFYSIFLVLLFICATQAAWGQTPDSTNNDYYRTVVTDRINDPEERERARTLDQMLEAANKSFSRELYFAALNYYSYVLKADSLHPEALRGYGESAFASSALDSAAEAAFQRMVDHGISPSPDYFPKMRLAEVKFRLGRYDEAGVLFDEVATTAQNPPVSDSVRAAAAARSKTCIWASQDHYNPSIVRESLTILDTSTVNTREFSEYASYPDESHLYFSAYRFDWDKDKANPERQRIKLLTVTPNDANVLVEETEFNDLKRQHAANITFNGAHDAVYYCLGDYVGKTGVIRLDIYRRKKQSDGFWGLPEKLNSVNANGFTTTQPSIGKLPGNGFETLFFVSDRHEGAGRKDKDIWFSHLIGDSLTTPQPLVGANTNGDDVTPFYHTLSNTLYFSTDGGNRLETMGGLDVYKSKAKTGGQWEAPKHMGTPINTYANDAYFVLDKTNQRGYLSNNLRGSSNNSEEGCCYDIYSVDVRPLQIKAIGYHALTKEILPYTQITLYEKGPDGTLTPIGTPDPVAASTHLFDVKFDKDYVLIAEKQDFTSDRVDFRTPSTVPEEDLVYRLYLKPHIKLIASVYDDETYEPIYSATAKFYDLGFRNESGTFMETKGGGQTDLLSANSNSQTYPLDFEHKYLVIMQKEGYIKPDTSEIFSTIGMVNGGTFELKLYLGRPRPPSLADFLPIPLYFDNDHPKGNPRDTVSLDYQKYFVEFIKRKAEFKRGFTKDMAEEEKQAPLDSIEYFFEKEVRAGWEKFFEFSDSLYAMLGRGDAVEITIKGYASPRADSTYNFHLTNRRTASVYNHFKIFDGGVFNYRPDPSEPGHFIGYYKPDNTGQLKIHRDPNGESKAPPGISDKADDPKNSIYHWRASRERRVEIVGVRTNKQGVKKTF